jgi:hypothetical protein
LVFQVDDVGPWYFSEHQPATENFNAMTDRHAKPKLLKAPEAQHEGASGGSERQGSDTPTAARVYKKELQDFARNNAIDVVDHIKEKNCSWIGGKA